MQILLIEDNESFGYILSEYLSLHEFEVHWVKTAQEGLDMINNRIFDLGIFDIMLPDQNGYEIAAQLRKQQIDLPFIFLSAKSLKIDKLKGYNAGAIDYITKPIDEELLLAKIKALTKRSVNQPTYQHLFSIGKYHFDANQQRLSFNNQHIRLTQREAVLLRMLCLKQNQLLSRKQALNDIWGSTDEFSRKSMDVFISHLRKYLKEDTTVSIDNIHGKGFILRVK